MTDLVLRRLTLGTILRNIGHDSVMASRVFDRDVLWMILSHQKKNGTPALIKNNFKTSQIPMEFGWFHG